MPGLLGFYTFGEGRENWEASRFLHYGLSALQGRGPDSVSLATITPLGDLAIAEADHGVEDFERSPERLPRGFIGIGQTSSYDNDYLVHVKEPYELVLGLDGKTDLNQDRRESIRLFAEQLSLALREEKNPLKATARVMSDVRGGYSFVALTHRQELLSGRNSLGVKPLEVGSIGFDIGVVASETCALDVIGAEHTGAVQSGEVVLFTPENIQRARNHNSPTNFCAFEYVYLARLDSNVNGIAVSKVRNAIGRELAKLQPVNAEVVVGVPETALAFAAGYSQEASIPHELGFTRTGKHTRTALKPTQFERLMGVQLKLNPIKNVVDDRDVVLIDDSVVRGNTLRNTVLNLKRKGARRIHVRIGSPALVSPCPFGVEVPAEDELISQSLSEKEIADVVGGDSFAFMSREALARAVGLPPEKLCMRCFKQREA